jgi:hypothetical protein
VPERRRLPGDHATTAHSGQRDPREKPFFDSLNYRVQATAALQHATRAVRIVAYNTPNNGMEPTAYSVRCAPAFGSGSCLALL